MGAAVTDPALPPGFTLDAEEPPVPAGFTIDAPQVSHPAPDPSEGGSTLQFGPWDTRIPIGQGATRFLAGAGKQFHDLGVGAQQLYAGAADLIAPRQQSITSLVTGKKTPSRVDELRAQVAENRRLEAPLNNTFAGKAGAFTGGIATLLPTMAIPGANTVAGAGLIGAGTGLLQPSTSTKETLTSTAIGGAAGAASQSIGQKVAKWAAGKVAARQAAAQSDEAVNSVRDATLKEVKAAGYVVPPTNVNRSAAATAAESLGGKHATEAAAAIRNQKVTNEIVRKELGLAKDAPLTVETLKGIRDKAGSVYKAIQNTGEIATDGQYIDDLAGIAQSVDDVAKDFPDLNLSANEEITNLVDAMLKDKFSAKSAIELTKQLRKAATGNLSGVNAADPAKRALGMAQRDAAAAVEDQLLRHLDSTGKGALGKQFEEARRVIAKTYSVEAALNPGTGNVIAKNLGAQLKRGKPLSGGFETIAKFSQTFPKAAAEITDSKGVSKLSAAVFGGGAGAALASGNVPLSATLAAVPAASYATRSALLSKTGQAMMATPSYAPNALATGTLGSMNALSKYSVPIGLSIQSSQK